MMGRIKSNVKIVSDGHANNTIVSVGGVEIEHVSSILIHPISPDELVKVTLTVNAVELDMIFNGADIDGEENDG